VTNEPSGLSGAEYARNNQATATHDDNVAGRWVAVDESGWDGEQLYARADRYLSIGSVATDDDSAALIVDRLRQDTALRQPPELKFSQFTGQRSGRRMEALAELIEPQGALAGRACVYLVDKHFFVTAKIIDLLLEEEAHEQGLNLYGGGGARQLAVTLFVEGPRALGRDGFDRLIETMVGFASMRNRNGTVVTVEALFSEFQRAFARAHRRRVADLLAALLRTRAHAEYYLSALGDPAMRVPAMEPLIPCLPMVGRLWSRELGAVSMLVDEHRVLTDDRLDLIAGNAALDIDLAGPAMGVRRRPQSQAVRAVVRGISRAHPSIQLADLIAGAGQAVARRHAGAPSPAGERLYPSVVPLISAESLVPYDSTTRFSSINQ
jgi:hypothetical protein